MMSDGLGKLPNGDWKSVVYAIHEANQAPPRPRFKRRVGAPVPTRDACVPSALLTSHLLDVYAWAQGRPPYAQVKKKAALSAAFFYLLPGFLKYLKNSEFVSITITSPWSLKLAR